MSETFKKSIEYVSRAAHTEEGWIHPLRDVVADVSAEEAAWKPGAGVASIWELIAHATPYIQGLLARLRGEGPPDVEDWPTVSETSKGGWDRLRSELIDAIDDLQSETAKLGEADLLRTAERGTLWESIADIAVHDAYHAGQVVKIRQLFAAQKSSKPEAVGAAAGG